MTCRNVCQTAYKYSLFCFSSTWRNEHSYLITSNASIGEASGEKWPPRCSLGKVKVHLCWFFILLNIAPNLGKDKWRNSIIHIFMIIDLKIHSHYSDSYTTMFSKILYCRLPYIAVIWLWDNLVFIKQDTMFFWVFILYMTFNLKSHARKFLQVHFFA